MKTITVFLAAITICLSLSLSIFAQVDTTTGEFEIGGKRIVIPPPAGFVEAAARIPQIKERFAATEAEENDMLAVHIPAEDFRRFNEGNFSDLSFYTKISVSKRLKTQNATQPYFAQFVSIFKGSLPVLMDPKGEQMKGFIRSLSENLSKLNQEQTAAAFSKPVNLGLITDSPNAFGTVLLMQMTITANGSEYTKPILTGMSAVRVNERILFVYTFKVYENEHDIDAIWQFSKKWLDQIAAANKNAP